jgi:hypothetical protein
MEKKTILLVAFLVMLCTFQMKAQSPTQEYFAGKWSVLLKGLPDGDTKMILLLDKKDTTITGVVQDSTGKEIAKITSADLKENQLTIYFTAQGYDVSLLLNKKDDDHVAGSLMGMFDATGDRIKETKDK